jgi:hypothetical protein
MFEQLSEQEIPQSIKDLNLQVGKSIMTEYSADKTAVVYRSDKGYSIVYKNPDIVISTSNNKIILESENLDINRLVEKLFSVLNKEYKVYTNKG